MVLSDHQPAYLPWLGLFHKIALSDVFCVLDTVPYRARAYINRSQVKGAAGPMWLTVPVHEAGRICDVRIASDHWRRKHIAALTHAYRQAPYFSDYAPDVFAAIERRQVFLTELTSELLRVLLAALGLNAVRVVTASDYDFAGTKAAYLLDMALTLGASAFIFGARGRDYASVEPFARAGITAVFQDYRHPVYRQRYGAFIPNLSVVDLLFNEGPRSMHVLLHGNARSVAEMSA